MAKKRTINEIRQTKEYYTGNIKPSRSFIKDQEAAKQMAEIDKQEQKDELEVTKDLIVNTITKHLGDTIFEMVCEEMSNHYLFQSENYLTQAGYDEFEETWFEFYHEHHGDILYQVMKNITN